MHRRLIASSLAAILLLGGQLPARANQTADEPAPTSGSSAYRWYVSDIDGSYQPYGVYIPTSYNPAQESGTAIVGLHGFGGSTTDTFSSYLRTWADTNNTILLSLQGRGNQNWDHVADEDMFAVLADLGEDYNVDPGRLFVEGCSMGGHGTYRWALRYPDMFAAAAPQSGWTSYEDFYFKWYAGLAEDVGHWGFANGNQPPTLSSGQYADPSRKPLLETASALYQLPNAKYTSIMMNSSTGDTVNYPQNAVWIRDGLQNLGYTVSNYPWTNDPPQFAWRQVPGGHCASNTASAIYPFFVGKTRVTDPPSPVYTTNTLKYNEAYWVRIDRLEYANEWASINPTVTSSNRIDVMASNVTQYTLSLNDTLINMSAPVSIYTNGLLSYSGPTTGSLTLYASRSATGAIDSWSTTSTLTDTLRKTHTSDGPIGDAFRSAFVVVYGTSGSAGQTVENHSDANEFVNEWNAVMIQSKSAWGFPAPQHYLSAIPDTEVTADMIQTRNLRLFGDQSSNSIIGSIANRLPVKLLNNGIQVGNQTYQGIDVRYSVVYPNPLNPDKYVVVGKGYLTDSTITGTTFGKNLEYLPWGEPDYVVWDASIVPGPTVQNPDGTVLRNLLDTYLQAGFFDQNWAVDLTPPITTLSTQQALGGVQVTLSATDNLGGFGVSATQYRLDDGPWTTYTTPFTVDGHVHRVDYRSTDAAGRDTSPAGAVNNNTEASKTALVGVATLSCDQVITDVHKGPLTVNSSLCVLGGAVNGPVAVKDGASLAVIGGTIRGPVTSTAPGTILLCESTIAGPLTANRATGQVIVGGTAAADCGANTIRGPVSLTGISGAVSVTGAKIAGPLSATRNTGGLLLDNNTITGPATVSRNTGTEVTVSANTIGGPLSCTGNSPAPSDAGTPNKVRGPASGQCRLIG